jgi:hypothetical protein
MKLTKADIDEAERVIFAIMEECKLVQMNFDVSVPSYEPGKIGLLNEQYRQAMNEQATESPF